MTNPLFPTAAAGALLFALAPAATAQLVTFSIDYRGPTVGFIDSCMGIPITEADILFPATPPGAPAYGPLPPPCIAVTGAGLGLGAYAGCVGHPGGTPCGIELDALSYGRDHPVQPIATLSGTYAFSVDECAMGIPGTPRPPAIWTEFPGDAAADIFHDNGLPPGPIPPAIFGSYGVIDGNGLPSASAWVYPGTGLLEPNFPGPVDGDNLDAFDQDTFPVPTLAVYPVYFSLDGVGPNFCNGLPKTTSGPIHGFSGADVVVTAGLGGPPALYAPALALGLDLPGFATDDLDALALVENGIAGYQPSVVPYDWLGGGSDMLLFSVCSTSLVVGMPDSMGGFPISPGDILTTPIPTAMGGVSPFPAIFVSAEALGQGTLRSGFAMDDNLDALDTRQCPEPGTPYCFGDGSGSPCPCGNFGIPGNGCDHSFGFGGGNLTGTGKAHVSADTLTLTASNLPPSTVGLYFQALAGTGPFGTPFGDGLLCTTGAVIRLGAAFTVAGTSSWGAPVGTTPISVGGAVPAGGGTRYYQHWYRNAAPFCTPSGFNLTNAYAVVWVP